MSIFVKKNYGYFKNWKISQALHIQEKKPNLNVQSESVKLKLFNQGKVNSGLCIIFLILFTYHFLFSIVVTLTTHPFPLFVYIHDHSLQLPILTYIPFYFTYLYLSIVYSCLIIFANLLNITNIPYIHRALLFFILSYQEAVINKT